MENNISSLIEVLVEHNIRFATGVPDSVLATLIKGLDQNQKITHLTATNEGSALAIAIGYHLASNSIPLVYLQNSGIGNLFNPYISLAHEQIYNIPSLFLIGWRGKPGEIDEPQHIIQGQITIDLLSLMGINVEIVDTLGALQNTLIKSIKNIELNKKSIAILIPLNLFQKVSEVNQSGVYAFTRAEALNLITQNLIEKAFFISTTGKTSRELEEIFINYKSKNYFLTIGGMGHCSSIALGISATLQDRMIVCLDGDGATQMHLGALATIGNLKPSRFIHFIFDNGVHESVGGQPVSNPNVKYTEIAKACGYNRVSYIYSKQELTKILESLDLITGPQLYVIKISPTSAKNLGRPKGKPEDWKKTFMQELLN